MARKNGYALAMNRDEKLTRPIGLPPRLISGRGRRVIAPAEPGGGTWIALNDGGATLALINWYSVQTRVPHDAVSRGTVVNAVRTATSRDDVTVALARLPLKRINPFRLISVFPTTRELWEWRWNLRELIPVRHPWRTRQWISSGLDEPAAQRARGAVFRAARKQAGFGTLVWLRRLHRSHLPETGPLSTCMHRAEAATVSYTEILASAHRATMRYHPGPPCEHSAGSASCLQLSRSLTAK